MFRPGLLILIISSISVVDSYNCRPAVKSTSASVCSNDSTTGNIVYLSGVKTNDDTTECSCSLSAETPTNITINTNRHPHGCYNKFKFLYATRGKLEYTCEQPTFPIIPIDIDDSIEIKLLPDNRTNVRGFAVCLEIKSEPSSSLRLSCGKSRWSTTTSSKPTDVQTSDTESRTTSGDESNQFTSGNESNQPTSKQPTTPNSDQPTSASESDKPSTPALKNDNSMSAIIGGSVGGLVVIIVIIILVICVLRKRRRDKTCESPEAAETEAHPYQNIPDNRSGEITYPYQNISDNRLGEITHQPKQNNEVVHQENDPYTSIDNDIIKPSNGIQGMEYLENDLYISSDDVTDDVVVDDKPKSQHSVVAEYEQVNKSNANKTTNGKCKTGPKGDNYAVVNKGGKMINNDKQFKIGPSGDQYAVVTKEGKKNSGEGGTEFEIGPSGDQYAVVNKMDR